MLILLLFTVQIFRQIVLSFIHYFQPKYFNFYSANLLNTFLKQQTRKFSQCPYSLQHLKAPSVFRGWEEAFTVRSKNSDTRHLLCPLYNTGTTLRTQPDPGWFAPQCPSSEPCSGIFSGRRLRPGVGHRSTAKQHAVRAKLLHVDRIGRASTDTQRRPAAQDCAVVPVQAGVNVHGSDHQPGQGESTSAAPLRPASAFLQLREPTASVPSHTSVEVLHLKS